MFLINLFMFIFDVYLVIYLIISLFSLFFIAHLNLLTHAMLCNSG